MSLRRLRHGRWRPRFGRGRVSSGGRGVREAEPIASGRPIPGVRAMTRRQKTIGRIGVLTGGGDCPGLNAVIRAVVRSALNRGWEVLGIQNGFEGLLKPGLVAPLRAKDVRGILHLGGTILGTTNRADPFHYPVRVGKRVETRDLSPGVVRRIRTLRLDALVVIGGDGTLRIAQALAERGVRIVGVPKTIDNDIPGTVITFQYPLDSPPGGHRPHEDRPPRKRRPAGGARAGHLVRRPLTRPSARGRFPRRAGGVPVGRYRPPVVKDPLVFV